MLPKFGLNEANWQQWRQICGKLYDLYSRCWQWATDELLPKSVAHCRIGSVGSKKSDRIGQLKNWIESGSNQSAFEKLDRVFRSDSNSIVPIPASDSLLLIPKKYIVILAWQFLYWSSCKVEHDFLWKGCIKDSSNALTTTKDAMAVSAKYRSSSPQPVIVKLKPAVLK